METGSSKSLYTLIAVVIFGIFLALSYWLFGDQLQGVLGSVTGDASYTMDRKLSITLGEEIGEPKDWKSHLTSSYSNSNGVITFGSNGTIRAGIYIDKPLIEANEDYYVSYDITKVSGNVTSIGGHDMYAIGDEIYLDGVKKSPGMFEGVPYPNDNVTHHVEYWFNSNNIATDLTDKTVYIQPNRTAFGAVYVVRVENVQLVKLNN